MESVRLQMDQMRRSLDLRPDQIDIADVLPIFVPGPFFDGGKWMGPLSRLRAAEIGLTWSVLQPNQTMRYVDPAMKEHWEAQGIDWKEAAMENLSRVTQGWPGLGRLDRPDGELAAVSFMCEDGYGPSRLLFRTSISTWFPQGYRVAIPEMSCAFAYAKDLDGEPLATILGVIDQCYKQGTRPVVPGTFHPDDLLPVD
jgi:hypothetical protein